MGGSGFCCGMQVTLQCVPRQRLVETTNVTNLADVKRNHVKWVTATALLLVWHCRIAVLAVSAPLGVHSSALDGTPMYEIVQWAFVLQVVARKQASSLHVDTLHRRSGDSQGGLRPLRLCCWSHNAQQQL